MNKYEILYSNEANEDLDNLTNVIMYKFKAPLTAVRYLDGLRKEIKRLELLADALPYYTSPQLFQYWQNTKRIVYKEMTVIFAIFNATVFIYRVIPSNTLK